ncbi:uncharacterized protein PFL1_00188 [Pseudozyma flocculosa PF-1]|uniref:uncharacterized protein n=1 Tax=Pseudozyma flocculosa PF-1 TaxID=1277687 RepID=UPI00045609CB|nr:uncharacterized protein PFL1_00188 [Pseudozyma flocculosa PF-1]EPQ31990.1 hypothetical protein PFL1_00188 [Pseudozyma flocculosa PF-1]
MGLVCSRPISDFLEGGFLKGAELIDHLVRLTNRCFHGAVTVCFSAIFGRNSALVQERKHDQLYQLSSRTGSQGGGGLYTLAGGAQRLDEKKRRSERRRRAEAAALGVKVTRKRSQRLLRQSLGEPVRAPPPRPEAERETAREREKGRLWVMGNVAASAAVPLSLSSPPPPPPHHQHQQQPATAHHPEPNRPQPARLAEATETRHKKSGSHHEGTPLVGDDHALVILKQQRQHPRQVSAESNSSASNVEVIASSSAAPTAAPGLPPRAAPKHVAVPTPRTSSRPSPVSGDKVRPQAPGGQAAASGFHSKPQALVTSSTSDLAILQSGAMTSRKGTAIVPPTDVSGNAMLRLSAAPLTTAFEGPAAQTSKAKQELRKQRPRASLDIRRMEPELRPAAAAPPGEDAGDAPRKERKVWKDEVERLALQKMMRQDAAARRSSGAGIVQGNGNGKALRRIETHDARLRWEPSTATAASPQSPTSDDATASPTARGDRPALQRRASEKQAKRRRSVDVAAR